MDEPLVWYEGSGTSDKRYLAADGHGSIVWTTGGTANTLAVNSYDEYGLPASTNDAYGSEFRYTGQQWMSELGMSYYKARIYSPSLGRFVQTDPIGYGDQVNLYTYVANDPVNGTDPTGKVAIADDVTIGAVVLGTLAAAYVCEKSGACPRFAQAVNAGIERFKHHVFSESTPTPTPQISPDKQGKHQPGHRNFDPERGRSEITHPDPQGLVDEHAGTGDQKGDIPVGQAGSKEVVDFGQEMGIHVDQDTGARSPTSTGTIHYDKEGNVHIVPARP